MKLIDADQIQYVSSLTSRGNGMYENIMIAYKDQIDDLPTIEPENICVAKITLTDEQIMEAVEKAKNGILSIIEPERQNGKWIIHKEACGLDYMECSRCKWITEYYGGLEETWDFCPHCGCEMCQEGEYHETD